MNFRGDGHNFPVNSGYSGFELCNCNWHVPVLIGTSLRFFVNHFHNYDNFSWFQYSSFFAHLVSYSNDNE
jgi:hypothetical protein